MAMALWAQEPAEPTIRTQVRQVLVPAVVTDKSGHYVTGLHAADFEVYEDDVRQDIAAFSVETAASAAAEVAPVAPGKAASKGKAADASGRTIIICFDTLHTSVASLTRGRQALEKIFASEKGTGARFALIGIGMQIQVFQTATPDTGAVLARLKSNAFNAALSQPGRIDYITEMSGVKETMESYCRTCPCGRAAQNRQDTCNVQLQQIKRSMDAQGERWGQMGQIFLAGLSRVTDEMARLDGPKSLVLVSDGFTLKPGREFYGVAAAYVPNSPYFREDPTTELQPALDKVLKTAAGWNIPAYTIDLRGVYIPSAQEGSIDSVSGSQGSISQRRSGGGALMADLTSSSNSIAWENGSVMSQLAKATGGTFYEGSNDLVKGFHDALADGREYYAIAYTPKNDAADGKYRRIVVKVKDQRMQVRAKTGYWSEPASRHP